jgi:branched-chain amino acid transport system ATP-binding protein
MTGEPLLLVRDLWKAFGGVQAVAGIDLAVSSGEIAAVIGPNGAGKTTLFNVLAGQERTDRGSIRFRGGFITGLPPWKIWAQGLSRTFQIPAMFPALSVLENVQVGLFSAHGVGWHAHRGGRLLAAEARALLDRVGLGDRAEAACRTLVGGALKRLELAMALANEPTLLLLDEPGAGMTAGERGEFVCVIQSLRREREVTILFTEHDMDLVFAMAERIVVLHQGRVVADGEPAAVRGDREVQRIYLGETVWSAGVPEGGGADGLAG